MKPETFEKAFRNRSISCFSSKVFSTLSSTHFLSERFRFHGGSKIATRAASSTHLHGYRGQFVILFGAAFVILLTEALYY